MKFKTVFFLSILFSNLSYSQTIAEQNLILHINENIVMPEDTSVHKALLSSVNAFLLAAQENSPNKWILASETIETQILIDELEAIRKNKQFENDTFFKAHLANIIPLEKDKYAIQVAYMGINENTPILRANFELVAHKADDIFLFSSPLKRNTQDWTSKKVQNHTFYYPYEIEDETIEKFANKMVFYDEKLKNNVGETHFYLCTAEINPLKLFGVDYKSDYNGNGLNTRWYSKHDEKTIYVLNESQIYNFDTHDLWHNRLSQVISRRKVHRRVDCHIATLYGGIWGKSWEELFPIFSEKYVVSKDVDWLKHKEDKTHFITNGRRKNYTDDFIGALLVRKIEEEKGFEGVWELLKTKRTKAEEEYFSVLEKLIGITKNNYNQEVQQLIEIEMNNLGI